MSDKTKLMPENARETIDDLLDRLALGYRHGRLAKEFLLTKPAQFRSVETWEEIVAFSEAMLKQAKDYRESLKATSPNYPSEKPVLIKDPPYALPVTDPHPTPRDPKEKKDRAPIPADAIERSAAGRRNKKQRCGGCGRKGHKITTCDRV